MELNYVCCTSTGQINENVNNQTVIYPSICVKALTFVDDIGAFGSREVVEAAMLRSKKMEDEKLMEFSADKTKWLCVKNGREAIEEIEVDIKQGRIKRAEEYKYLGNWINEKGNMDNQLNQMEKKASNITREYNVMCAKEKMGEMEYTAKLFVYEKLIIPSLFYNIEAWSVLREKDKEKLEVIQGRVLKGIFGLPKSTPYWGVLYELDILPIHLLITYRKLMIYHMLLNSKDERIAKRIVKKQEEEGYEECWLGELKIEGQIHKYQPPK